MDAADYLFAEDDQEGQAIVGPGIGGGCIRPANICRVRQLDSIRTLILQPLTQTLYPPIQMVRGVSGITIELGITPPVIF